MNTSIPTRTLPLLALLALAGCAAPRFATEVRPCQTRCETHTEGYEWAQRSNLGNARVCDEYDEPFAGGCRDGVEDLRNMRPAQQGI